MRAYGFSLGELVFDANGFLPRERDPKLAWALSHPEHFPIEVNTATLIQLLRIPGIGPKAAKRILSRRSKGTLRELRHLGLPAAEAQRAAPFILLDGKQPPYQLPLFCSANLWR